MEALIVKKKEYKIESSISEGVYKVSLDGKFYIAKNLGIKSNLYYDTLYAYKRISSSGISCPKLIQKDKKTGVLLYEYFEAPTIYEILSKEDLSEKIIEKIFTVNYYCKCNNISVSFNPQHYCYYNDNLYYMIDDFDEYDKSKDFTQVGIKLWFYTSELRAMLKKDGIQIDDSRIKPDFAQNKEILMTTVKFYK